MPSLWIGVEVGEARVGKSGVELLGFKKGKRSVALDDLNLIRCSWLADGKRRKSAQRWVEGTKEE